MPVDKAHWYALVDAEPLARYTAEEACINSIRHGNWGPVGGRRSAGRPAVELNSRQTLHQLAQSSDHTGFKGSNLWGSKVQSRVQGQTHRPHNHSSLRHRQLQCVDGHDMSAERVEERGQISMQVTVKPGDRVRYWDREYRWWVRGSLVGMDRADRHRPARFGVPQVQSYDRPRAGRSRSAAPGRSRRSEQ